MRQRIELEPADRSSTLRRNLLSRLTDTDGALVDVIVCRLDGGKLFGCHVWCDVCFVSIETVRWSKANFLPKKKRMKLSGSLPLDHSYPIPLVHTESKKFDRC